MFQQIGQGQVQRRSPSVSMMRLIAVMAVWMAAQLLYNVDAFSPTTTTQQRQRLHGGSSSSSTATSRSTDAAPRFVLRQLQQSPTAVSEVPEITDSATKFSGSGPAQVDMNMYNLQSLDDVAQQWTAVLTPADDFMDEGVYLRAKDKKDYFVDTLKVVLPRKVGQGLGCVLYELAGGRDDGLGITIISEFVEGGVAESSELIPGDSIVKISVYRKDTDGMTEEIASVDTECLGYDATVNAIMSLPQPSATEEQVAVLTVKRLRRKPKVKVNFQYPPEMGEEDITIELFAGENLRRSMLVKGIKLNDPLARRFDSGGSGDCGAEGTCATCSVSIVKGMELLNDQGDTEKQILANHPRWRMACKTIVGYGMKEGEMTVRLSPRQWTE